MPESKSTTKPEIMLLTGGIIHKFDAAEPHLLATLSPRFNVTHTRELADLKKLSTGRFKTLVLYMQSAKDADIPDDVMTALESYASAGGGIVAIHCTNCSFKNSSRFAKLIGSSFDTHGPVTEFDVRFTDKNHPVAARCEDFRVTDELYLLNDHADYDVFAVAHWQGRDRPMAYQRSVGDGKVFYLANGHDPRSLGNRYFQRMLERAVRVASGETLDGEIKVGVIGYGGAFNMGKQHAGSMIALPGFDVTTICDLDPSRTEQAKVELGSHIKTYNDMDAFLNEADIDMVVEILPHNLHVKACIAASKAGKHVVSEKPFCLTLDEADAMLAAADEAGKVVSCFHNRRWDGEFWQMLKLIREGAIGDVYRIDAASAGYREPRTWWRSNKSISGGELYDWGAHFTDWVLNIANKRIRSVTGDFKKNKWHAVSNEDYCYALIRFEDDTTATIEQGSAAAIPRDRWRVLGTHGGITDGPQKGKNLAVKQYNGSDLVESIVPAASKSWEAYYANVGNHLLMGEELVVKPYQARRTIGVIELAEKSAAQGGVPLPMPGEDTYEPDYMMPW